MSLTLTVSPDLSRPFITRWQTLVQALAADFREALANEEKASQLASESFLKTLVERYDKYMAFNLKLGFVNSLLVLSLFVVQFHKDIDVEILGFSAKGIAQFKELILLVSALLTVAGACIGFVSQYRAVLITQVLNVIYPEPFRPYLSLAYSDTAAYGAFYSVPLHKYRPNPASSLQGRV